MSMVKVNDKRVCCNGGDEIDDISHPIIYLDMGKDDSIACPYCGRVFIYDYETERRCLWEKP